MTIKTNPNLLTLGFAALSLFFTACGNQEQNNTTTQTDLPPQTEQISSALAVAPPINGLDVPYENFTLKSDEAQEITTANGSRLLIPANAFVDQNGAPITGEVSINYREFHNAGDIIASGIPMHEPETGAYMQTAGMFEIKGEQDGQEIFMKSGKPVRVEMVSQVAGDNYNFYQLGAKDCRWQDKGTKPAQPNTHKLTCLRELETELEATKSKAAPRFTKSSKINNFVFDLDVDYRKQKELKLFKNIVWEYTGDGPDPEENEWIFDKSKVQWHEMDINPLDNGYYTLSMTNDEKEFSTTVRPVLTDDDYEKALKQFNNKTNERYTTMREQQKVRREGIEAQSDLIRSFNVNDFGIYNWDIWKNDNRRVCTVRPKFDALAHEAFEQTGEEQVDFFLVNSNNKAVVRYDRSTLGKFSYNPADKNVIVAVLPNGRAALGKIKDFYEFEQQQIKDIWNLELETVDQVVSSVEDINALIALAQS